jgi:hypothetical protein
MAAFRCRISTATRAILIGTPINARIRLMDTKISANRAPQAQPAEAAQQPTARKTWEQAYQELPQEQKEALHARHCRKRLVQVQRQSEANRQELWQAFFERKDMFRTLKRNRGRPNLGKPWENEGISRSKWFRDRGQ